MNFEDHWNTIKVDMDKWVTLDEEGLLYTEGLGPCIGVCLAFGRWAGIIHSSHPPYARKEFGELISEAKKVIPYERLKDIQPVLCGSNPAWDSDDDPEEYKKERLLARKTAIEIVREAGFGEPIEHWSEPTEAAAIFADLKAHKIIVEVGCREFEYPIQH